MVYLLKTTESQPIFIPKSLGDGSGSYQLTLKHTAGLTFTTHPVVDLETSANYYRLAITLPSEAIEGEYEYTLTDGNEFLSRGLIFIQGQKEIKEYDKIVEYEQFIA